MLENIRVAIAGLTSNKLRAALTMLGITIGVASVILLISLGQAVQGYILGQFNDIGTDLVFAFGTMDNFGNPEPLTENEYRALTDPYRVPDAEYALPTFELPSFDVSARFDEYEATPSVLGTTPRYGEMLNRGVIDGRMFEDAEVTSGARVAVIGLKVVEKLFAESYPIGQDILINGVRFEVIGIWEEKGGGGFGNDQDDLIVVPITAAQERLSGERTVSGDRPYTSIVFKAKDPNRVDALVEQVRQTLREERGITFRDEDNFEVATMGDLLDSLSSVTGLLTVFLGVIAGISLVVGGIGIMNIMLVTVTERTREIGLRKAVGAPRAAILLQFLTEASVLALVGGAIGVTLAWGGTQLISALVPDLAASVQGGSVVFATMISLAIGVFFGIYPASRAAGLNPIEALRYE
jgi:putative ABC transport system permease protein